MVSIVIDESKKVAFLTKSLGVDKANKVYVDKLIELLYFFLWTPVVDFCNFSPPTVVID